MKMWCSQSYKILKYIKRGNGINMYTIAENKFGKSIKKYMIKRTKTEFKRKIILC